MILRKGPTNIKVNADFSVDNMKKIGLYGYVYDF